MTDRTVQHAADRGPTLDVFGITDKGKVRKSNEDNFYAAALHKSLDVIASSLPNAADLTARQQRDAYLFVIADGVSRSIDGGGASGAAVESFVAHISETTGSYYGADIDEELDFLDRLQRSVDKAHERVREKGGSTTVTLVFLIWPRGYVLHVGDSRGYYFRKGYLKQFTRDQTMGELLVDEGVLTEEQASTASHRKVLFSALGAEAQSELGLVDFEIGDSLMLCTDGLTRYVTDDEIGRILVAETTAEIAARRLISMALERGGRDNVTVIVVRMGKPGGE